MKLFTLAATFAVGISSALSLHADEPVIKRMGAPLQDSIHFDVSASDIVYDQPQGERRMMSKYGSYYGNSMWGILEGEAQGIPCITVENDNEFWIYNPFTAVDLQSWLRGDKDGDKITFKLPQAIYTDSDGEKEYVYVAQMCYFEWTDDTHTEGLYYSYEGETEMVFVKIDGKWVMQQPEEVNEHPVIMGLVASDDGAWCTYSEWNTVIEEFSADIVEAPANLKAETWAMVSREAETGEYLGGKFVNVGVDGSDIYMQGISSTFPEAWVKGTVADGKAVFPSHQYLGANEIANAFGFFYGATEEEVYNEEWGYTYMAIVIQDEIVFDYDADNHSLTSDGTVAINRGDAEVSIDESFTAPRIRIQGTLEDYSPKNPIPSFYTPPTGEYAGVLYFFFPSVTSAGDVLNTDNLYYTVYVDDEPMMFYSDEVEGLPEDTEEIPFNFTNMNTFSFYGQYNLTHFFSIMFSDYDSLAVQTLYRDGDKTWASDIVYAVGGPSDAIKNVSETSFPTKVEWFDMTGRKVAAPQNGIYVKRTSYSDGSVKTAKVAL